MRSIDSGKLTKKTILEKIDQVSIFSRYLNIREEIIHHCINTGELILSPIRHDINPTCGFRYDNRGKLKFKDFAGYFWGDCFDLVAEVISISCNKQVNVSDKNDFMLVLRHISITFKDIFYGIDSDKNQQDSITKSLLHLKNKKSIIDLVIRNWRNEDVKYWNQFGVSIKDLNVNLIYPIDQYYINISSNPNPKYFDNPLDPCYAYFLGEDSRGIKNIKLYFPKRDKGYTKFITNCNHLEGIYTMMFDDYDIIIITKSTKDRISMSSIYKRLDIENKPKIGFINVPHETYRLKPSEYEWLCDKITDKFRIYSIMDNDSTGQEESKWLYDNFGIKPLFIPSRYGHKDFSDFVKGSKTKDVNNLIYKYINYEKWRSECRGNLKKNNSMPF